LTEEWPQLAELAAPQLRRPQSGSTCTALGKLGRLGSCQLVEVRRSPGSRKLAQLALPADTDDRRIVVIPVGTGKAKRSLLLACQRLGVQGPAAIGHEKGCRKQHAGERAEAVTPDGHLVRRASTSAQALWLADPVGVSKSLGSDRLKMTMP
jgi:hypothetical protein